MSAAADVAEIRRAIALLAEPGAVLEPRTPKASRHHTVSGHFSDPAKIAQAAAQWSSQAPGIYITLNPVNPALLARAENKAKPHAETTTQDQDILRHYWMLVDGDPVRPSGISSTEEEHAGAIARVREMRAWLTRQGWPLPILADSGNGGHMLYPIDMPNDDESRNLIKSILKALADRLDDKKVKLDTSVFNTVRITKLYGTVANKGDHTPMTPWRLSRIGTAPPREAAVTIDQLRALVPVKPVRRQPAELGAP